MAYCIRYFSVKKKKIITNFLGFSLVTVTTAIELHSVFKNFLKDVRLTLENLVGIGTDGAANLCGVNHSLFTLLKKDVTNVLIMQLKNCHRVYYNNIININNIKIITCAVSNQKLRILKIKIIYLIIYK